MKSNRVFWEANDEDQKIINEYTRYKKLKQPDVSHNTIRSIDQTLRILSNFSIKFLNNKPIKTLDREDLMKFFENNKYGNKPSRNLYGSYIIPFYRWIEDLDKHSRPSNMKWFENSSSHKNKINRDENRKKKLFITSEAYNKIINYCEDIYGQNKAMWETYYLSGFRPEELQSMFIEDVTEDKNNIVEVHCPKSKTFPRPVPLPEYPENLIRYIGNHPQKNNKNAPLWFTPKKSNKLTPLTMSAIQRRWRRIRKDLKLEPTLVIKSFRKTRASIMFNHPDPEINNDSNIAKYIGWEVSSVPSRRAEYNLTDYDDLKKAICKKQHTSKSYTTIEKENKTLKDKYEPIIKGLKTKLNDTDKQLANLKSVSDENRDNYIELLNENKNIKQLLVNNINAFKKIKQINEEADKKQTDILLTYFYFADPENIKDIKSVYKKHKKNNDLKGFQKESLKLINKYIKS